MSQRGRTLARHGSDYGENDTAMRWLQEHDPEAGAHDYASRFGIIDRPAANRARRHEKSFEDPDIVHTAQHVHCGGCKESQRRRVHA
jgi:hypothetical protein